MRITGDATGYLTGRPSRLRRRFRLRLARRDQSHGKIPGDGAYEGEPREGDLSIAIVRVGPEGLRSLSSRIGNLLRCFKRVNISLIDVTVWDEARVAEYERQLTALATLLAAEFRRGRSVEVNALTDRIMLSAMHNCKAGIEHLTVGADGGVYLCPAFWHDEGVSGGRVGSLR